MPIDEFKQHRKDFNGTDDIQTKPGLKSLRAHEKVRQKIFHQGNFLYRK